MSPDAWEGVYQIRGEDQIPKSIILQTASSCGVVFGAGLPGGEVANAMDCRSGSKELNLDLLINLDCVVCLGRTTRVFGTAHDMHVCYCCREHPKVRELSAKFRDYARDLKLPLFSITRRSCDQTPSSRIPADSPVLGEFFFFDPQASFALGCQRQSWHAWLGCAAQDLVLNPPVTIIVLGRSSSFSDHKSGLVDPVGGATGTN